MNPGNETCCFNHKGVKEITYHNTATIPTVANEWNTYYEDAGYSVPITTSDPSSSTFLAFKDTSISSTSTTVSSQPQLPNVSAPPSSQISTSTSLAFKDTSVSSTSTTVPSQPQLLNVSAPPSSQTSTSTPNPAPASKPKTTVTPSEKAIIGTVGAFAVLGAFGSVYSFRRSRTKRMIQHGSKPTPEAHPGWRSELMGHDTRTEMEATCGRPLDKAYLGGSNELVRQDGRVERAEMPG